MIDRREKLKERFKNVQRPIGITPRHAEKAHSYEYHAPLTGEVLKEFDEYKKEHDLPF